MDTKLFEKRICMRPRKKDSLKRAHSRVARAEKAGISARDQDLLNLDFLDAVKCDSLSHAKEFLAKGASINTRSSRGEWNALMWAARNGNQEMVEFLLASGIDKEAASIGGFTALHEAVGEGHTEIVKILLAAGVDMNAKNVSDYTAVSLAVGHLPMLNILLQAGADPDIQNNKGRTALMSAIKRGEEDAVKALLAAGAKVDVEDFGGNTAFAYAVVYNDPASMVRLADADANLKLTDEMMLDPLGKAKTNGLTGLIRQLKEEAMEKELRVFKDGLSRPIRATKPFKFKRGM